MHNFSLGIAPYTYADLHDSARLAQLGATFDAELDGAAPQLGRDWRAYRAAGGLSAPAESELLLAAARHLGPFVARLFAIEPAVAALRAEAERERLVFRFRAEFIARRVRRRPPCAPLAEDEAQVAHLHAQLGGEGDAELQAARTALQLLELAQSLHRTDPLSAAGPVTYAAATASLQAWGLADGEHADPRLSVDSLLARLERWHRLRLDHVGWPSYRAAQPIDAARQALVPHRRPRAELPEMLEGLPEHRRRRSGFGLSDPRASRRQVAAEVDSCLICHVRQKDSCRHGLRERQGELKRDALDNLLAGCPLDERISEAHQLRREGDVIAALAMICLDNPMCPGTGHRICNDCMKGCIFQKQTPIDIPQVETGILTDVLQLPYGFEVYSLLTRWNPLNRQRPSPRPYRGHNVLVAGLGPAGYTLAHHLLNEGFGVVAIDGLKLEPLPADWLGAGEGPPRPIRDFSEMHEALDERRILGFGGVAEYGITVRWDKNFLRVLYLNLARRSHFRAAGGIRLGGTLTLADAWQLGFDHVAIAAGAGRPTVVPMRNNLLRGMRAASDFLMGLQLGGAFRRDTLANLQVELPALVIGGGLTAIDTATEVAAYYPVQIERLLERVERLGEAALRAHASAEEGAALTRMLAHARALRAERLSPKPDVPGLVRAWGGVQVVYRRSLQESPAYRLNHEEVQRALEEGIGFIENLSPIAAEADAEGHLAQLVCQRRDGSEVRLPARCAVMAAGTAPNVVYEREHPGTFELDERARFFRAYALSAGEGDAGMRLMPATSPQQGGAFFTSFDGGHHRHVSFFGDNHPAYAGNVVKAMASAKHGHRAIARLFDSGAVAARPQGWPALVARLEEDWSAKVVRVERLGPSIVEVVVHAPAQARRFAPGQFYRLQTFEATSPRAGTQALTMEGLALTGAWVDGERGLVSMVALEMGTSSRLCALLTPGERVVLMGPTGAPTELPEDSCVLLCGGGLGNAVLLSIGHALRKRRNRVLYFAGYRSRESIFKIDEVEACCDQVIWSVDAGPLPAARRPQDRAFAGTIVAALQAYAQGSLGPAAGIDLMQVSHIIAIGSDRMMAAITAARRGSLRAHLAAEHVAIASINSPMQCMLKEVCAQCLQRHVDPQSGAVSYVFSCFNQDQLADRVDWKHLAARLSQNRLAERVSDLYLTHLLQSCAPARPAP